jgi:hypothetical protein
MKRTARFPWSAALKGDPLDWLLGKDNPPVRYLTLTHILDRPRDDPEVVRTVEAIWEYPPARSLLEAVAETPAFPEPVPFSGKYACRDLDTLVRFGIPGGHPAIDRACRQWLNTQPQPKPSCYPEQMIGGLIRYADVDDPRLQAMIRFVVRNQPFADGNRPGSLRYGGRGCCCGSHSCFSAVVRALWAVAGVPAEKRTPEVRQFLQRGAAFLAAHRLYKSNHKGYAPIKKEWLRLHLPFGLGWRTDVIDILDVATQIGLGDDPCVADALQFLIAKQNHRGRWVLEEHFSNYKHLLMTRVRDVEAVNQESKWITVTALTQLKRCGEMVARLCRGEQFELPAEPPRQPRFFDYEPPYDAADVRRVESEWDRFGMRPVLEGLLAFAKAKGLRVGWRWGYVMGPADCPQWCAAEARWIPRKGDKKSWPVCRVFFMARRGQFTTKKLSDRLGIPPVDEGEKARFNKFFWNSLWRIRTAKWKNDYQEVAVTLREPAEFANLQHIMTEALEEVSSG